jgi:aspartate/methionine/tyrosine aminotransferase
VKYRRMPIEEESPEQLGYDKIRFNLTESSVRDRSLADLGIEIGDMVLFYGDHFGNDTFRELIAAQSGGAGGGVGRDDVLVTAGAAQALFIIATSLLDKGDHLVVISPNYATNIETPRAIEADVSYLDLTFEDGFRIDLDKLMALVTPRTKYVSITLPHNPTGITMSEADLRSVVGRVEAAGCRLLVDETYREMTFGDPLPVAATLSDSAISVSSLSKTYGIPGIRSGWLVCRDRELMATFLAAKEQIGICGSVVDEEIAARAFAQRDTWLPEIHAFIRRQFEVVSSWVAGEELMEWVEPRGGCVCFPRIKPDVPVDVDEFYRALNDRHGAYVGPGHWFEQSRRHMRVGYGWPLPDELEGGLAAISSSVRAALTI